MAIIKKKLNFDLVLEGHTIRSMEELREYPSTELLDLHSDGRLVRWLRRHGGEAEAEALQNFTIGDDKVEALAFICQKLGMDITIDDIRDAMAEATEASADTEELCVEACEEPAQNMPVIEKLDAESLAFANWTACSFDGVADAICDICFFNNTYYLLACKIVNRGFSSITFVVFLYRSENLITWKKVCNIRSVDKDNVYLPSEFFSEVKDMSMKLFSENNTLFVAVKNTLYIIRDDKPLKIDKCIHDSNFRNIFYKENTWFIHVSQKNKECGRLISGKDLNNFFTYAFPEKYAKYESTVFIVDNILYAFFAKYGPECYLLKSENGKTWNESKLDVDFFGGIPSFIKNDENIFAHCSSRTGILDKNTLKFSTKDHSVYPEEYVCGAGIIMGVQRYNGIYYGNSINNLEKEYKVCLPNFVSEDILKIGIIKIIKNRLFLLCKDRLYFCEMTNNAAQDGNKEKLVMEVSTPAD